ncbi:hypothetical protein MJI47_26760, partial [Salmonella enterica subsp. enterica serovar Kentucky]|nr:hypothetical protein [Salmonella enterica subsp. enterica serovar Kentucky]
EKNVPIAVLGGTLGAAVIYIVSTNVIAGIVPNMDLANSTAPFVRFVIITNFAIMVGTWFSEQGVVIMLVELAFMIGILLSWYLFR